jgi:hypothetical protein
MNEASASASAALASILARTPTTIKRSNSTSSVNSSTSAAYGTLVSNRSSSDNRLADTNSASISALTFTSNRNSAANLNLIAISTSASNRSSTAYGLTAARIIIKHEAQEEATVTPSGGLFSGAAGVATGTGAADEARATGARETGAAGVTGATGTRVAGAAGATGDGAREIAIPTTSTSPQTTFYVKIGGLAAKIVLDEKIPINVMSKGLFRKMRQQKCKWFTSDPIALKIGDVNYCGQFTSKITVNGISSYVNFYVKVGEEDLALITKKMAQQLGLIDN